MALLHEGFVRSAIRISRDFSRRRDRKGRGMMRKYWRKRETRVRDDGDKMQLSTHSVECSSKESPQAAQ